MSMISLEVEDVVDNVIVESTVAEHGGDFI